MKLGSKKVLLIFLIVIISGIACNGESRFSVISNIKIWSNNDYCAFPSLLYYKNKFFCAFREASRHRVTPKDSLTFGKIVIIESEDMKSWSVLDTIFKSGCDLRDPQLSVTPKGDLNILYFCREYSDSNIDRELIKTSFISRLNNNGKIVETKPININCSNCSDLLLKWLWREEWLGSTAYGFMYGSKFILLKSKDNLNFEIVYEGYDMFTEASLVFEGNNAYAVARAKDNYGYYGRSTFPFTDWKWKKMDIQVGGPDLFLTTNGCLILGTRNYSNEYFGMTSVYAVNKETGKASFHLILNKQHDSSYPSIIEMDNMLLISYYSGSDGTSDIYLAEIKM